MTNAHEYAQSNAKRFLDQLQDLIRIPSISTDPTRKEDVTRTAQWLAYDMDRIGFDNVEVVPTAGHPVVYGEWNGAGPDAPTVLIYGHYDVQPADMVDGWNTQPFEPVIKDGKLYARGASDDKGQMLAQLKAVESLLATGGSPVNIKFMVEGEEEIGSENLLPFILNYKDRLKADVCVISDSAIAGEDTPSIVQSLRGLIYMELVVTGPARDLHSGSYGGTVHNPVQALAEIIAQLHNPDGSVAVTSFYDDVLPLSDADRVPNAYAEWRDESWFEETGAPATWGEAGYSLSERVGARPSLEINGMAGGFYGEGAKTVLPSRALAKISCRLVANQNPDQTFEKVRDFIASITPPTVHAELRLLGKGGYPAYVDRNDPMMRAAITAYEQGWGKTPLFDRGGGSIPVVADFQRELGLPVILMGFGLNSDNLHGPNESFTISMFHKGIDTAIYFLEAVAEQAK
jgi:acetylornithine deacetylase/succinyl-diaminopimelate desuccinylase-like protein